MAISKRIREIVYKKYDGHCAYCGKEISIKNFQIDHIIPVRRGDTQTYLDEEHIERGMDDISNLMPSCRACNFRKDTMDLETFRSEIREQAKRLMARSFQARMSEQYGLIEYHDHPITFYFEKYDSARTARRAEQD